MIYRFDDFEIDTRNYQLRKNGAVVEVEPKVFDLLSYLAANRDKLVTRDELFENLWSGQIVSDASLSNQIKAARKAIGDSGEAQASIKTIHGRGYQFIAPTEAIDDRDESPVNEYRFERLSDARLEEPDKPSIAVLPFTNMSGDPAQEYFSDGITEDIITELSRFGSLFVVARNSSFQFRDTSTDIREISNKLGVRFILEGSVRIAGKQARITGQLINGNTAEQVWAERYDGDLSDVFAVQDEIARSIVSTIAGRIDDFDLERIRSKPTVNLSAYESLLRGQQLMHTYTKDGYLKAQKHFDHAISLDPNFARAHALRAYVEFSLWVHHMDPELLETALRLGEAALALDERESKSHLAVGVAHLFRYEHEKAENHLTRAAKLNPNDDLIMIENGRLLMYIDEPLAAEEIVRRAMRQNPYHPNWYWNILGRCLHTAKKYDEAISCLERVTASTFWIHAYLAACYAESGQAEKATEHREATISLRPGFTISEFSQALPYRDEKVLADFLNGFHLAGFPA